MLNWKTSLFGILAFLAFNLDEMGVSPRIAKLIAGAAIAGGFASSKDKDVTGAGEGAERVRQ